MFISAMSYVFVPHLAGVHYISKEPWLFKGEAKPMLYFMYIHLLSFICDILLK